MKNIKLFLTIIVLLLCTSLPVAGSTTLQNSQTGHSIKISRHRRNRRNRRHYLKINRIWQQMGMAYATVTFKNNSGMLYNRITLKTVVKDRCGNIIGTNSRVYKIHIGPYFTGTLLIPVRLLYGRRMFSITCTANFSWIPSCVY